MAAAQFAAAGLYLGARPGVAQPSDSYTLIVSPCFGKPALPKPVSAAAAAKVVKASLPSPTAAKPVVSIALLDAKLAAAAKPATGIKCSWAAFDGTIPGNGAGQMGAPTSQWTCPSCGSVAVNKACTNPASGCAPATVTCTFDPATSQSCVGAACYGGRR